MSAPESLPNIAETPVGPLGGWLNIDGNEVPLDLVAPRDKKAEELVRRLLTEASALNETLAQFRERAMADIQDFRDWSIRKCGIRSRAKKGCCTLYSYDGSLRVDLHTAGVLSLNERIEAVRAHIAECLDDITAGAADVAATRALVDAAFATDSAGGLNVGKVLSLRRVRIKHPAWVKAMKALAEATEEIGRASYVRFYRREGSGPRPKWVAIPLALSAV